MLVTSKFVFLHIPRTGGMFLRRVMAHNFKGIPVALGAQTHVGEDRIPEQALALPRYAAVRNPWDWHVSWFEYYRRQQPLALNLPPVGALAEASHGLTLDFAATIHNLYDGERPMDLLSEQVQRQIGRSLEGGLITVGRFETLREDFAAFLESAGIPMVGELRQSLYSLPGINGSKRRPYRMYYDDELYDLVGRKASWLIDRFDYKRE